MKAAKIIVAGVVVLGTAVAITWLARDRIIQRLTGPLLEGYGWVITDVSLDALATRDASLGYIELAHQGGMVVAIEDLVLAVRPSSAGRRGYRAQRVTVTLPEQNDDDGTDVAAAIRQVLGLPDVLADIDVSVGEFRVRGFPPVDDFTWSTFPQRQVLGAEVGDSRLGVELLGVGASEYEARLDFAAPAGEGQRVNVRIEDLADSVRFSTVTEPEFVAWRGWLERAGLLPPGLGVEGGGARVEAALDVPNGPAPQMAFRSTLVPDSAWQVRFGGDLRVTAEVRTPIDIVAMLPDGEWSAGVESADVDLDGPIAEDLDFRVTSIACRSGIVCTFETSVIAEALELDAVRAEAFELSAHVEVEVSEGGAVAVATMQPGAVMTASAVTGGDAGASRIEASFVSETTFRKTAAGWELGVDSIDMLVEGLVMGDTRANASLFLEGSSLASGANTIEGRTGLYVPSISAAYAEFQLSLPGVRGNVKLADQRIVVELQTVGLQDDGRIRVTSDLATGAGELLLAGAVNDFADRPLSKLVDGALQGLDLTAGSLALDTGFQWHPGRSLRGEATVRLANVAGLYSAIAFTGVETEVDFSYHAGDGLASEPAAITASFVDIGVALRDISARYRLRPDEEAVEISALEMSAFGGAITTDPFSLDASGDDTTVVVHARSVNLAEMLSIQEFEAVEVTGHVDADLPVTLGEHGVRIADGRLSGLPPGGVIRYRQGAPAAESDTSAVGFATRALSNFEYETLSSDVSYAENGDLVLKMQIRGRNPDFEDGRPIVLNIGVENNVRDMLRSLQATRSAQEVIERRVNR